IASDMLTGQIGSQEEFERRISSAGLNPLNNSAYYNELQTINALSKQQLEGGLQESDDINLRQLYAIRLGAIESKAGKNVVDFAYKSGMPLTPLDYGSGASLIKRAAETNAYSKRFDQPINSLFTDVERKEYQRIFSEGYPETQVQTLKAISQINIPEAQQA
ncbi:hypothetical protein MHBO_005219, partial [Bonamia ostreae]